METAIMIIEKSLRPYKDLACHIVFATEGRPASDGTKPSGISERGGGGVITMPGSAKRMVLQAPEMGRDRRDAKE